MCVPYLLHHYFPCHHSQHCTQYTHKYTHTHTHTHTTTHTLHTHTHYTLHTHTHYTHTHTHTTHTLHSPGTNIANIVNEAALHASREKETYVREDDFDYTIERVIAGREDPAYHVLSSTNHFQRGGGPVVLWVCSLMGQILTHAKVWSNSHHLLVSIIILVTIFVEC